MESGQLKKIPTGEFLSADSFSSVLLVRLRVRSKYLKWQRILLETLYGDTCPPGKYTHLVNT